MNSAVCSVSLAFSPFRDPPGFQGRRLSGQSDIQIHLNSPTSGSSFGLSRSLLSLPPQVLLQIPRTLGRYGENKTGMAQMKLAWLFTLRSHLRSLLAFAIAPPSWSLRRWIGFIRQALYHSSAANVRFVLLCLSDRCTRVCGSPSPIV